MRCLIAYLWIFLSLPLVFAQLPDNRNHPELQWQEIETEHFRILYHQGLEALANKAANIAETHYYRITCDLRTDIPGKTTLILSDVDDISNGSASPLNNTIFLWTYGANQLTTGTLPWLERVIGHEFGHIATFWASRNCLGKWGGLFTLGTTPTWFLEGISQYEAETWDVHRNMLLRIARQSGALLPTTKLDGFVGADQIDGRLVYEQGHGLVRYLSQTYGENTIAELIAAHRKWPFSFSHTLKRTLGKNMSDLYTDWLATLPPPRTTGQIEKKTASFPFQAVLGIRTNVRGEIALVATESFDEGVQRLYVQESASGKFHAIGGPHVSAFFNWSSDGRQLIYSRKHRGNHGGIVHDLYSADVESGKERPLTSDQRATDPCCDPAQDRICYVRHLSHGSGLFEMDLKSGYSQTLFYEGNGSEVFAPAWSFDGSALAFSYIDSTGQRDLAIINRDGSGFKKLTDTAEDERTPVWHPSKNELAYCNDQNGTPELWIMTPATGQTRCVGTSRGGLFNPSWQGDSLITAIDFENRYQIQVAYFSPENYCDNQKPARFPEWAEAQPEGFGLSHAESTIRHASKPYASFKRIEPLLTMPFLGQDDEGMQLGLAHYAADPLDQHQILGYALAGKRIDTWVQYTNAQFQPLITLAGYGLTENQGHFPDAGESPLWQRRTGLEWQISFPFNSGKSLLSNHSFSVLGTFEYLKPLNTIQSPYPNCQPFKGHINELGLAYAWAWQLPDVAGSIHPGNGMGYSVRLTRADKRIQSDRERTLLTASVFGRKRVWDKQALAARIRIVQQWGTQPYQERRFISSPSGLRALKSRAYGSRFLLGTLEYRIPLISDMKFAPPLLYFERLTSALWTDWGKAWGNDLDYYVNGKPMSFRDAAWLCTAGIEFRTRVYLLRKLGVVVGAGWGRQLLTKENGRLYLTIGSVF